MSKLFGTDGIRGIANEDLTPELAYKVGRIGGYTLNVGGSKKTILIGRDTRYSGPMLEAALVAGLNSVGIDTVILGVVPTPAVAYLIRHYKADGGIVISASHNPGEYNGIKIFNEKGFKLRDEQEEEIENKILSGDELDYRPTKDKLGSSTYNFNGGRDYIDYLKTSIPLDLSGKKVAMDCGNGALYEIGPKIIEELGGQLIAINTEPNGMNINQNCGSTNPDMIVELVKSQGADIGISFDGDGDRIIACDEEGNIIDGDHILAICGSYLKNKGKLNKETIVGTVMTNMGLDEYLKKNQMEIVKTKVGDRYILEEMLEKGYSLGGEQSGHIIFLDYNTTGDGLATGLHLLEVMDQSEDKLSELNTVVEDYPQVLVNAKVQNHLKYNFMDNQEIREEIARVEDIFNGQGRVLIRPSGTEPLVRVMIEAKVDNGIETIARELANFIESKLG